MYEFFEREKWSVPNFCVSLLLLAIEINECSYILSFCYLFSFEIKRKVLKDRVKHNYIMIHYHEVIVSTINYLYLLFLNLSLFFLINVAP